MLNYAIINGLLLTVIAGLLYLPVFLKKRKRIYLVGLLLSIVFLYNFILVSGQIFNSNSWNLNWSGLILSTLFALIVIRLLKRKNKSYKFGLTLKQNKGSLKSVFAIIAVYTIIEIVVVSFLFGKAKVSLGNYIFQLTLPGITEELIFRGLYLVILNKIFTGRKTVFGAPMGYSAIVITILFALGHGISIDTALNISFNLQPMAVPFILGIVIVWIRERTGSVLIPILFHNFTNVLGLVIINFK
jgi:membrane protease YdiL (CAAX protease family)